jgi:hypothetical protein
LEGLPLFLGFWRGTDKLFADLAPVDRSGTFWSLLVLESWNFE